MQDLSCTEVTHVWRYWVTTDAYKKAFASWQGKARYVFVRLGVGVHVTSHMFNLSAGVNVFWENKIPQSILNRYSRKDKQFFNTQCFSKETKLCLFSIIKYTETCCVRATVSSILLQV